MRSCRPRREAVAWRRPYGARARRTCLRVAVPGASLPTDRRGLIGSPPWVCQRPWGPWGHRQQGAAIVQGPTPLPDGEDEGGRAEGQQPGGGKRQVIGTQPDAQEPAAVGGEGGPDLMAEEHPAKEDRAGAGAKEVGRQ